MMPRWCSTLLMPVGDGIADQDAAGERDNDVPARPQEDVPQDVAGDEQVQHVADPAGVPVERVPGRDAAQQDRVDATEGEGEDRVEREQEQDQEPDDTREGREGPEAAWVHLRPGLEGRVPVLPERLS